MVAGGKLSKSCNEVLRILCGSGREISQKEIAAATGFSIRCIKYAVKKLVEKKLAREFSVHSDLRRKKYSGGKK